MRFTGLIAVLCFSALFAFAQAEGVRLTLKELARYDGSDESLPILMALKGVIYDVTSGKRFYGKDSPYQIFAGKDGSVATALASLEPSNFNKPITGLSELELRNLDEVVEQTYKPKYPVYGELIAESEIREEL